MLQKLKPTQIDLRNMLKFTSDSEQDEFEPDEFGVEFQPIDLKQTEFDIEKRFDIDTAMNDAYRRNKNKIMNESIRPIDKDVFAYYNSLNILVGNQGKGKSHIVLRDIIQISRMKDSNFHLIVYISKSGTINDSTFEAQQDLIQLPIECVTDTDADKYLKQLDLYKDLYAKCCKNDLLKQGLRSDAPNKDVINKEVIQQMFEFLHVDKFNKSGVLNTIIICEDFVRSALLKSAYFTNYITQLRHKHSIVYVNVQFFKAIPTDYKNNATSFIIFSGFSKQKLNYLYYQIPMNIEFDDLWHGYSQLKGHDIVYINVRDNLLRVKQFG